MTAVRALRAPLQERSKRTREALLAAGAREFSERGYAAATAKSIAARAAAATGSFYQYFSDKDALLREIALLRLQRIGVEALAAMDLAAGGKGPGSRERVKARMVEMVDVVMRAHRDDPGLHAVLTERRHADPELDALTGAAERTLCDRVAALLARWELRGDRRATAFVLVGMVEGSVHAQVLGKPMVSDARFVATLVEALLRVITGR